jgi:pimeloyl-ACP methyl ester carboxylesterase
MGLAYQETGSGEPLLLIHGMGSASSAWKLITPILAKNFKVISIDLPGHGGSSYVPSQPMDPHALAVAIHDQMQECGYKKIHLAGNSFGGWIALDFAATFPESVLSVTAIAPAGLWLKHSGKRGISSISRMLAVLTYPSAKYLLQLKIMRRIGFAAVSPRWRDMSVETCVDASIAYGSSIGYYPAWDGMLGRRFDLPIAQSIPVTVLFGDSDHTLPKKSSQERSLVPAHTRWIVVKQSGHAPMWDSVNEVCAEILRTAKG